MNSPIQDLRYGFRLLWKSPGFTFIAVITLALGIGVNTAVFSVVNAVVFKPLPFPDPARLTMMWVSMPGLDVDRVLFSPADFADYAASQKSFESVAIFENQKYDLTAAGPPEQVTGARVSASLFTVLGVQPVMGRAFLPEEDQPGREQVVILSNGIWKQRFGANQSIVGQNVYLNRQPYIVVGVMPAGFEFPLAGPADNQTPAQLFVPTAFTPAVLKLRGAMYEYSVVARLKPGITIAAAESEAKVLGGQIQKNYPPEVMRAYRNTQLDFLIDSYHNAVAGQVRKPMLILLGAVTMVLLIACANVANLLLSRGAVRQRELSIRLATGASRQRLFRQVFTESLVLAVLGGICGMMLAKAGKDLLLTVLPASIPRQASIELDGTVFGFTLILCVLAALVFGSVSAIESSRASIRQVLQESSASGTAVRQRRRLQSCFAVSEFAIALGLLIAAGLLFRSFSILLKVDPGFQPDRVLGLKVALPRQPYATADQVRNFYRELVSRAGNLPGVNAAGLSSDLPLLAQEGQTVHEIDGQKVDSGVPLPIHRSWVMGDYLKTLRIPLMKGRNFTEQDTAGAPLVAIISQSMAQRFWPGKDAIGRQMKVGPSGLLTIIGVVGDVKDGPLGTEPMPHVYTPYLQERDLLVGHPTWSGLRSMSLVVLSRTDPESLRSPVRAMIAELDPQLTTTNVSPLSNVIHDSVLPQRFNLFVLSVFAVVAVFLAMVGIYGVISYAVRQRTREIGVRMALGAAPDAILRLVLREAGLVALWGTIIGITMAFILARTLRSLLYGIAAVDPLTFATAAVLLVVVSLFACLVPALRAMRIDPNAALRYD